MHLSDAARPTVLSTLGVLLSLNVTIPETANAQFTLHTPVGDYSLAGEEAWGYARAGNFTFRPVNGIVSRPYDGLSTTSTVSGQLFASVKHGGLEVYPPAGSQDIEFELYGGKQLAPGWTFQSVELQSEPLSAGGRAPMWEWVRQPQRGATDMTMRVRVRGQGRVSVRTVVLNGPALSGLQNPAYAANAFLAPVEFTVSGSQAWQIGRQSGFRFAPLAEVRIEGRTAAPSPLVVTPPTDGTATHLVWQAGTDAARGRTGRGCVAAGVQGCLIAGVDNGQASVQEPVHSAWRSSTVGFELFGGRPLAPGWNVVSVSLDGGTWVERPRDSSLRSVFTITARKGETASARISSIRLRGPGTAKDWRDAFAAGRPTPTGPTPAGPTEPTPTRLR